MSANLRQQPYRVATLGFSEFERTALASCLRLSEQRVPAYVAAASTAACELIIADADAPEAVARVVRERRAEQTVFIGAVPPTDAVAWLVRPIEPAQVMRALDGLLAASLGTVAAAVEPSPAPAASVSTKRRPNRAAASPRPGGGARPVLVVDDSEVARAFLSRRLQALDYRVSVARSAAEAIEMSAAAPYAIVFLDLKLGDHDAAGGLHVCRTIKQRSPASAVVITTASGGQTDRVRGSLAGCDAYLTKPLLDADFSAALQRVDPLYAGR